LESREKIVDFGIVPYGSGLATSGESITNLNAFGAPDFAASLDLDSIVGIGDTGAFDTGLTPFSGLAQGDFVPFFPAFSPTNVGAFAAEYTLNLSDEDLPGEQFQTLTLILMAEVILVGDYNRDQIVNAADYTVWRNSLGGSVAAYAGADGDGDMLVDDDDYQVWKNHFGETAGGGSATFTSAQSIVPEPAAWLLALSAIAASVFPATRNRH
jgi:hypothetical protein